MIEWSMSNGFDEIATATDVRFERILQRAGWPIAFGFSPPDDPYFATRLRDRLGERGADAPPVKD
ncbi:acyl-homoserine-lactone synthase [Bradyrhizobium japonicum]|nr:hypothetical protein [Bradyrhizobium japonicum]MCW2319342.1 hypothetical protein [Bradyrhizobium japonicum]